MTLFALLGIGTVVVLFTIWPSDLPANLPADFPAGMTADDIERAALQIVHPLPGCLQSWIGGTVQQCDEAQAYVAKRRKEFAAFDPIWMRKAILDWFDFAEGEIQKNRDDCITQASSKNLDDYRKRSGDENDRVQKILRSIGH